MMSSGDRNALTGISFNFGKEDRFDDSNSVTRQSEIVGKAVGPLVE